MKYYVLSCLTFFVVYLVYCVSIVISDDKILGVLLYNYH